MRLGGFRGGGGGGGGGGGAVAAFVAASLLLLLAGGAGAQSPAARPRFKTLSGNEPLVIAHGGFSGVLPDSSQGAYAFALLASAPGTSLWCNVQLTKDSVGICLRDINMKNCTDVQQLYPTRKRRYIINDVPNTGWFPVDFNMSELRANSPQIVLTQAIWSRTDRFDYLQYPILSVTDMQTIVKPSSVWLNVQHDIFYKQHGLNMTSYILSIQKNVSVKYISSPELGFLQSISGRVSRKTKLVFIFLDKTLSDPSTNQTYGSLLSNLTRIKMFASGIMVPKSYIWPLTNDNYLLPSTSIVRDAHNAGLEIYASGFANDVIVLPYNYSYDPLEEYLSFISNGDFSVDGVLTDYPITASEAIGCFANLNISETDHGNPLIISHNGASGDYPDCTDLAYLKAINDGADVIDCPVQLTRDGVLMCMSSINLFDTTNVQKTPFSSQASLIPEIQATPGIFTFNLTWNDIDNSTLRPKISSPVSNYYIVRNPRYTNQGKFLKLSDFLTYGKHTNLSGVMIIIEHAAFMAKSLGFDIVDLVNTALSDAGYNDQTAKEVMIQSKDSAILVKLKQQKTKYKLVYTLPLDVGDASASSLVDVKKFADAVVVDKYSVFQDSVHFIIRQTNLVKDLQTANLTVYAQVFRNEFVSQQWDFFADATVEINTFVQSVKIDGIITDFPKTVRRYKRNSCTRLGKNKPAYMDPVAVGGLAQLLQNTNAQPPAEPPMPELNPSDVVEAPLPSVAPKNSPAGASGSRPTPGATPSDAHLATLGTGILLAVVWAVAALLI